MKQLVLLMLCLWHNGNVLAQIQETFWHWQVIDTVKVVCVYNHTSYFTFRSEHLLEHEPFRLEIGNQLSKYYSLKQLEGDSLYYTTPQAREEYKRRIHEVLKAKGDAQHSSLEKMTAMMPGGSGDEVYKNYPVQDSMLVHNAWHGRTKYIELMEPQTWEIQPDTMHILGFTCQRACCKWRGRDYEAWFTEDVPISDGPYKFFGLPGLIVTIADATGEYGWKLESIEMPTNMRIYLTQPLNGQEYKPTDRLTELRMQWKSRLNMVKKANADAVMLGKEPTETEDPYDQIELDYK